MFNASGYFPPGASEHMIMDTSAPPTVFLQRPPPHHHLKPLMVDGEYLVIRNSKSAPSNSTTHYEGSALNTVEEATTLLDDKPTTLNVNLDASLSIVTLVKYSEGKYMLDFVHEEEDSIVASFLVNHTTEQRSNLDDDCKQIFIESISLKYLQLYAVLLNLGTISLLNDDLDVQPFCLQYHLQHSSFHLLPDHVQEVLNTLLPLEQLFSWSILTSARETGHLHWKDIRNFLANVKRNIPFTAVGPLLHHIIQTHLTFHQFVAFAKLVERHLQGLPNVKVKIIQASTLSVNIQLTSNQNCTVCIGCLNDNECPPTAQQLKDHKNKFVSWECINLVAESTTTVRLVGLKEGTVYDSYIYVSRTNSEFPVASTDDDVLNSRCTIETQGYHLIDVFPVFDSMTKEEQGIELFASIKDKAVRLRAQADGLVLPGLQDEESNYDNETWRLYIEWWKDNIDVRYNFCMRELIFASQDEEVRRNAQKDGIVMSHDKSRDQAKRERWTRSFGLWYYYRQESAANSSFPSSAETLQYQGHPPRQTLNLSRSDAEERKAGGLRPRFPSKASKAEAKSDGKDEDDNDTDSSGELGEVLVLQSLIVPQPQVPPPTPPPKDFTDLSSTTQHGNEAAPSEPDCCPDKFEVPQGNFQVSNELNKNPTIPPKPSRLTIGVVGQVVSFRHRFLRRLSTRIDTCLALTRPKTPSSLRGIALFRAKVRLVMLLQKVSHNDVDIFSYQQRDTRSANSAATTPISEDEEEEDSVVLMDMAVSHYKDVLARNVFRMMRSRAKEVAAEKRAKVEKILAAVRAFDSLLLHKCFQAFVEAIRAQKESKKEKTKMEAVMEAVPEVGYTPIEDEDSCVFNPHWNTEVDTLSRNSSSDSRLLIDPALLKPTQIKMLDDETLSGMRCAKRAGASNLYDVPEFLLRFDDLAKERPMDCFRNREISKSSSTKE